MKNLKIVALAQGMAQVLPLEKEVSFMCIQYVAFPLELLCSFDCGKEARDTFTFAAWRGPVSIT
jgi:hypothetical protein